MVTHTCNSTTQEAEADHEFEDSLAYIASSRSPWDTQQDPVLIIVIINNDNNNNRKLI
jgi:hypothetical protein